jgi:hypothetical protein
MRSDGHRSIVGLVPKGPISVEVFCELRRLMAAWREDPDRLAVAVTAYEGLGYTMAAFEIEHGAEYPSEHWDDERCHQAIARALRGRSKQLLRAQARGLVLGLVAIGPDARRARLHDVRAGAYVIECRELSTQERLDRLTARAGRP